MRKRGLRRLASLPPFLAALALGAQLLLPGSTPISLRPSPTEHRLDGDAERVNRKDREAWIEELHRRAPGTDWRALERANGIALQELRANSGGRSEAWTEIGSRNQAGRIHCATISVSGDSLYAGSDRGGLWKADLWGNGWRPLSDNIWGGVHLGVAAAGQDPEVVSILSASEVIRYSVDQGETWQLPAGLPAVPQLGKRILRDPADPDRVYLLLASQGQGTELYRSDDAGRSYTLVNHTNNSVADFWIDRVSGGTLYLMISKFLHRSDDQGATWTQVGELPSYPSAVILAGSEAGAPTFYVAARIAGNWELWRSADAGASWEFRNDIDDFWETMNCSTTNADLVMVCGVEAWRSTNGGVGFTKVNGWGEYYGDPLNKLHADNPGLEVYWHPTEGELFFPCTDGGIYRSDDACASVTNLSLESLGVSQYYDVLTDGEDPWRIAAGAQDQGYQWAAGGPGPIVDFDQLISGDYAFLTSWDGNHSSIFCVYPGFTLLHYVPSGALVSMDFPAGASHLWLPPIVADPEDQWAFYFCGQYLYRGRYEGGHAVYTHNPQDFTAFGGSYLSAFSISPLDLDRRLACTNTGQIWFSHDAGETWQHSPDQGPSGHYFHGNALAQSGLDTDLAWLGGSGYDGPAVYRTLDGGTSWEPYGTGLPPTLVYMLATESPTSDVLYAATEAGPYRLDPDTDGWEYIGGSEAPLTTFWSVEAVPAPGAVRFGTYGRGIWDFDVSSVTAVETALPAPRELVLSNQPNPFNPKTTLRFELDEAATVRLAIYDAGGRRVRELLHARRPAGGQRVDWDGRDDAGVEQPSGVYFARVVAGERQGRLRLTLLR